MDAHSNIPSNNSNKGSHIKRNINKALANSLDNDIENDAELIKGINVNDLKEKYQPKRVDLKLNEQLLQQNRDLFNETDNDAVIDNLREFHEDKLENYENQMEPSKKKA
jgi:hypothetical protein